MLNLDESAIGKRVKVTQRMSSPDKPFTIEAGATGLVRHVTVMQGRVVSPSQTDPTKMEVAFVPVPVAWVDFWDNFVCFAVVGDALEFVGEA